MKKLLLFVLILLTTCSTAWAAVGSDGCILWNKLSSTAEVEASEIGNNGIILGTLHYESGKFNNGVRMNSGAPDTDTIEFGNLGLQKKGAIEAWVKPLLSSDNWPDTGLLGGDMILALAATSTNNNRLHFGLYDSAAEDVGYAVGVVHSGTATIAYPNDTWDANELIHLAMAWDEDAGFDGDKTIALYKNGVEIWSVTTALNIADALTRSAIGLYFDNQLHTWGAPDNMVVDNLKVWDYPKIDFSDRFIEGFSEIYIVN